MTRLLGLFVKHPQPGCVKTRLAADVGPQAAAELYAAFVADLTRLYAGTGDARVLAYSPPGDPAREWVTHLAAEDYQCWLQPEADLGTRMAAFFDHGFSTGAREIVLIGSDSPNLPRRLVDQAFAELQRCDVVLGPATDGGFYLVGQREQARRIFDDVPWSSSAVFGETVDRVRAVGASLAVLPVWYDVDTLTDAQMLRHHLMAAEYAGCPAELRKTSLMLQQIFGSSDTS